MLRRISLPFVHLQLMLAIILNSYQIIQAQVVINEVAVKPGSSSTAAIDQSLKDCNNLGYGREYVELYNTNACNPVDISCYIIANPVSVGGGTSGAFRFPVGTIILPLGFISVGGALSGATFLLPNYCSGPNSSYLQTAIARWYLDNSDTYVALYDASGIAVDVVYWSSSAGNWQTATGGLNVAPSQIPNPGACSSVSSLAGPASFPSAIVSYGGASPNLGTVINRTQDGGSTWVTNATPTLNNCNGICATPSTPTVTITGVSTICSGSTTTLSAAGGNSYSWWNNGQTTSSITVSPTTSITYTVTGTNASGCTDTSALTITIISLSASISGNTNICAGTSTTLTASGGSAYSWSIGSTDGYVVVSPTNSTTYSVIATSGTCADTASITVNMGSITASISGNTSICPGSSTTLSATGGTNYSWTNGSTASSINISPTSTTTYSVIASSGTCADTASITVNIGSITASISGNTSICSGNSTTLSASGGTSYSWTTGALTSSIIVSPTTTTNYSVVATTGACSDAAGITVSINPSPTVSISGNTNLCAGDNTTLTASGGTTYSWSNGTTSNTIALSPSSTTNYTVVAANATGCTASSPVTVTVLPPPVASATSATICSGQIASLTAFGGTNYSWSNGATASSITVSTAGTYSVVVSAGSCSDATSSSLVVNPNPTAAVLSNTTISVGQSATLTASGGGTYNWSTGETNPIIIVSPVLTTSYCVTVINSFNCNDLACATVTVDPIDCSAAGELYFPNAFSPNNDNENETFGLLYGNYVCIKTYYLAIYNRWGEKVFETIKPQESWGGSYGDKKECTDVFAYYAKIILVNGDEIERKGNISLIK